MSRQHQQMQFGLSVIQAAMPMLPDRMNSRSAVVHLLAFGMQESRFVHRRQIPVAYAMGFWQFELGGGVRGVMRHRATAKLAAELVYQRVVKGSVALEMQILAPGGAVDVELVAWKALEHDDILAVCFARLFLWTDPHPLVEPLVENAEEAWQCYLRTWRPGKPHRHTWDSFWRMACEISTPPEGAL